MHDGLDERILAATREGFLTLPQIKRGAGIEMGTDISPVIDRLLLEKRLLRYDGPDFVAFFDAAHVPSKIWRDGGGRFQMEFNGQPLVEPEKEIKPESGYAWQNTKHAEIFARAAPPRKSRTTPEGAKKSGLTRRKKFDYALVEQIAAESYSNAQIYGRLEISDGTFIKRMKDDAEFCAAIERGRARRPPKEAKKAKEKLKEKLVESNGFTIEKKQSAPSRTPQSVADGGAPRPQVLPPNVKVVELASGARVVFGFEGDLFQMPRPERDYVNQLIDLAQNAPEVKTEEVKDEKGHSKTAFITV